MATEAPEKTSTDPAKTEKPTPDLSQRLALSPAEVGILIGCSRSRVFEMITSGLLPPSYKVGRARKFKRSDIERWVEWNFPNLDRFLQLSEGTK